MKKMKIKTRFGNYDFELSPWGKTIEGRLFRKAVAIIEITSKTRSFVSCAVVFEAIDKKDIPLKNKNLSMLKKDKTKNMIETARDLLEGAHGKGKIFPGMRGRFTVLKIKNKGWIKQEKTNETRNITDVYSYV